MNKSKGYANYSIFDYQRESALIINQILSTILKRNVWRSVWRICMLILGLKGLIIPDRKAGEPFEKINVLLQQLYHMYYFNLH